MHVLAVSGDDRHLQPRNPHIEVRHRGAVDESQADALARREDAGPVPGGRRAVHQVCVCGARHVGEIGRVHPHLAPHLAVAHRGAQAVGSDVAPEIAHGPLMEVVVVGSLLQLREHALRTFVRPVGEHHDVLAVVRKGLRLQRVDDQRPVEASLLLKAGVAVIPVGPALPHLEPVKVCLARTDAFEAQAGNTVHVGGQQDAMPVNGCVFLQRVGDAQRHRVPLLPPQRRCRHGAVDGKGDPRRPREVHRGLADAQIEIQPREGRPGCRRYALGRGLRAPHAQRECGAADGEPFHEGAAGRSWPFLVPRSVLQSHAALRAFLFGGYGCFVLAAAFRREPLTAAAGRQAQSRISGMSSPYLAMYCL